MPLVRVGSANIQVCNSMRYLGVIVDGSWKFRDHLKYIENKATKVVRSLSRIMPNLRGPGERKRRLFATIVTSVVMYAAPVWGETFSTAPDKITRPLRRLQRAIAIRTIAAYRTVSFDAATVLARMPPWRLEAILRYRIYSRITDLKARNEYSHQTDSEVRNGENLLLIRQWDISLSKPEIWGKRTVDALRPLLRKWLLREFGEVNLCSPNADRTRQLWTLLM
ncbi:Reverse transcriptase [Camponotus japonicus]